MHCDTSTRPILDVTLRGHPRAVHAEVLRFVRGVRVPRQNPVRKQAILKWLARTPAESVERALDELVAEGKVRACPVSKRAVGYVFAGVDHRC